MFSHTVPEKLLSRFAYLHAATKSLRLWRYQKDREVYSKASPRSATTFDGFFLHPLQPTAEEELEKTLAQEIEGPVNEFLDGFDHPAFGMNERQRECMTRYVSLLFSRSQSRRRGSKHVQELIVIALNRFLQNEIQVHTVAAQWSLELVSNKNPRWVPPEYVKDFAARLAKWSRTASSQQANFVAAIRERMKWLDQKMFCGEWNILRTSTDAPFIISDAPVITWERLPDGVLSYGVGFERPNVEVTLPLGPATCLHILPDVPRNHATATPTAEEVNRAEAAFASLYCYADRHDVAINRLVQENISTAQMGVNVFTLWHRNLDDFFYELLMKQSPFRKGI